MLPGKTVIVLRQQPPNKLPPDLQNQMFRLEKQRVLNVMLGNSTRKPETAIKRNHPKIEGIPVEELIIVVPPGNQAEAVLIMNRCCHQKNGNVVIIDMVGEEAGVTAIIQISQERIMPAI